MAVPARGVQRALLPLVAGTLLAVGACSTSTDQQETRASTQAYGVQEPADPAPPGKFQTLPEPCGAVPRSALKQIQFDTMPEGDEAPGADARQDDDQDALRGEPTLTFNTDRRAGCEWMWRGDDDTGSRGLTVDFERVVSYDAAVSDEEQAKADYLASADQAGVPTGTSLPDGTGDEVEPSETGPAPRLVGGIGDEAFLTEYVSDDDAPPHQEVRLVFRDDNVIVTVQYQQWPREGAQPPADGGLQSFAHLVAQGLAKRLDQQ